MNNKYKLNDEYRIVNIDVLNIALQRYVIPKPLLDEDGNIKREAREPYWQTICYAPNLEIIYNHIIDREINSTNISDLKNVVDKIKELKKFIKESNVCDKSVVLKNEK